MHDMNENNISTGDNNIESVHIRQISADEFYTFYGENNTCLANYYAERISGKDGILSMFYKGEPIGYVIYKFIEESKDRGAGIVLKYIFVEESHRHQGCVKHLLASTERLCVHEQYEYINICLPESTYGFEYMYPFFMKNGYILRDTFYLFRCEGDDFKYWEKYMDERGNRLIRWLTDIEEYSVVSLEDIDENILQALKDSPDSEYKNDLRILPFLQNNNKGLVKSMCFVAVKNDMPAAYCLVSSPDDISVVFEQISVSACHRDKGVILLPFAMAMKRFKELGYKRAAYSMYEKNRTALAFAGRFLGAVTRHRKIQYNLEKKVKVDEKNIQMKSEEVIV